MNRVAARAVLRAALAAAVAALAAAAAGCLGGGGAPTTKIEGLGSSLREIQRNARSEGQLRLVTFPGYVQDKWARPFERATGCDVSAAVAPTSTRLERLLDAGGWDGVSASGDVSGRLMDEGDVAPLDLALLPSYGQIESGVKNQPFDSRDGLPYGMPQSRAADLLLFRTDVLPEATESWGALWDAPPRYQGRLSLYDSPMAIAAAALYLKTARPGLHIGDPFELTESQLRASTALVRRQAPSIGLYWTRETVRDVQSYISGDSVIGIAWPVQAQLLDDAGAPVRAVVPREGTTGHSDAWMAAKRAEHPNCMYLWLDYIASPQVQAWIAERLHEAPVNLVACQLTRNPDHCADVHADDEEWWRNVHYWATPGLDCGDEGEPCTSSDDWAAAWTRIKAAR